MTNSPEFQIPYPPHWLTSVKSYLVHNIFSKYHRAQKRGYLSVGSFDSALFICPLPGSPIRPKLPEGRHRVFFSPQLVPAPGKMPNHYRSSRNTCWMNTLKLNCIANLILVLQKHFPLLPVFDNLQKQCYKGLQIH